MTSQPSQSFPSSDCEELSDDALQAIHGGVAIATGIINPVTLPGPASIGNIGNIAGIRPFNCGSCVQGLPGDLLKNSGINQAINPGFSRY